jgi:hypothetical protein
VINEPGGNYWFLESGFPHFFLKIQKDEMNMKTMKNYALPVIISLLMILGSACSKDKEQDDNINVENPENCNERLYNLTYEMTQAAATYGEDRTEANCMALKQAAAALIQAAEECDIPLDEDDEVFYIEGMDCLEN